MCGFPLGFNDDVIQKCVHNVSITIDQQTLTTSKGPELEQGNNTGKQVKIDGQNSGK